MELLFLTLLVVFAAIVCYFLAKLIVKRQNAWKNTNPMLGVVLPPSKKEKNDE